MLLSSWLVATRGSVFFRRTWFAAMPIPIKSSELKRSSASCFEIPILFCAALVSAGKPDLLLHGLRAGRSAGGAGKLQRPAPRHHGNRRRFLIIQKQALQILLF